MPLIRARVPGVQFVVACAPNLPMRCSRRLRAAAGLPIVDGRTDDVLAASDVVITASGTATVQARCTSGRWSSSTACRR